MSLLSMCLFSEQLADLLGQYLPVGGASLSHTGAHVWSHEQTAEAGLVSHPLLHPTANLDLALEPEDGATG